MRHEATTVGDGVAALKEGMALEYHRRIATA